jgi:polyketide biosynthesis acyl carrier protein
MKTDSIFRVMLKNILVVLPQLKNSIITMDHSLKELGANSIDRAEIIIQSMSDMKLKVPLVEFALAKNIGQLVSVFEKYDVIT